MQATGRFARRNVLARRRPVTVAVQIQRYQSPRPRPLAQPAAREGLSPVVVMLLPIIALLLLMIFLLFGTA